MKKFAPLFLCALSLVGLVMVSFGFLKMKFSTLPTIPSTNLDSQYSREFSEAHQRILSHSKMLTQLSNFSLFSSGNFTVPLAGNSPDIYDPKSNFGKSTQNGSETKQAGQKKTSPISMIYVSNNMSRVVMNGNSYSIGDRLPDGATLVDISIDSITTEIKGRRQQIKAPATGVVGSTQKMNEKEENQ
jgi:hypothetical protein